MPQEKLTANSADPMPS